MAVVIQKGTNKENEIWPEYNASEFESTSSFSSAAVTVCAPKTFVSKKCVVASCDGVINPDQKRCRKCSRLQHVEVICIFCQHVHKDVQPDDKFCEECGELLVM